MGIMGTVLQKHQYKGYNGDSPAELLLIYKIRGDSLVELAELL